MNYLTEEEKQRLEEEKHPERKKQDIENTKTFKSSTKR